MKFYGKSSGNEKNNPSNLSRRDFVKSSTVAAGGLVFPNLMFGQDGNGSARKSRDSEW